MQLADALPVAAQISGELWRRAMRRLRSGLLFRWRFSGSVPEEIALVPVDLHPPDPHRATEFYSGNYSFGLESVKTGGESPFSATSPSREWFAQLHKFRWLRHHRASETELARASASALMTDWIAMWGQQLHSPAWRSDVVAARLIAWLCHANALIGESNPEGYRLVMRSMARQTRYLQHNVAYMRDGYPRLSANIALAYASLCLMGKEKFVKAMARDLDRELSRQILPDGGHISRNPVVLVDILADLLPLKKLYNQHGMQPSQPLVSAIDRMMGALKFLRHSNGDLAQFNGTGCTPAALVAILLRQDTTSGLPSRSAPHSGYVRLSAGKTVVLVDTGAPKLAAAAPRALAGTLSFELSSGSTRFIVNCGTPDMSFGTYAPFVRATAAHSTVTINDTSSSRFAGDSGLPGLLPSPLIKSPTVAQVNVVAGQGLVGMEAQHDGYVGRFSIIHKRELALNDQGTILSGSDSFLPSSVQLPDTLVAAIRFHLPAVASVSMLTSGHSIMVAVPNGDAWIFTCLDAAVVLEESIQFSGPGRPRKSEQIVIHVRPARQDNIRWSLEQRARKSSSPSRRRSKVDIDTPDLLGVLEGDGAGAN